MISTDTDNAVIAGADGALFVAQPAADVVTDVTDLNATGNLIGTYNNEEGDPFAINETVTTVTATAATGNTIATYTNEDPAATPVNINETITELAISAGALTYANEDATNTDIKLISGDTNNALIAGTDGSLFVAQPAADIVTDVTDLNTAADTNLIGTYNNEEGNTFAINETATTISNLNAATNKNLIGTYNNEGATSFAIEETVTSITFDDTTNELEYIDETGTPNPVDLSSLEHTGTEGSIFFAGADETPTEDNDQLFWDAANNRLGVGTNTPDNKLQVSGAIRSAGFLNSDGNAGEPSYRFTDDTNTGIYSPAADEIGLTVGGFEALRIDEETTGNTVVIVNQTLDLDGPVLDENDLPGIAGQVLTATATGTEWADAAAETVTTFAQDDTPTTTDATATGEITYTDEAGDEFKAQVVSADADNKLSVGTDGGAFFAGPTICAAGKIAAGGSAVAGFNATASLINTGDYQITFDNDLGTSSYVIQLTITDLLGVGNDDPNISYYDQQSDGFKVNVGDNDNGGSDRADFNSEFMFSVICLPGFGNGGSTATGGTGGGTPTNTASPTLTENQSINANNFADINTFIINFNPGNANAGSAFEILIEDRPYANLPANLTASSNQGPINFTVTSEDNGDGTYNHLITGIDPLPSNNDPVTFSGDQPSPQGTTFGGACSCVSFFTN